MVTSTLISGCPEGVIKAKVFKEQIHERTHLSDEFCKQTPRKPDGLYAAASTLIQVRLYGLGFRPTP